MIQENNTYEYDLKFGRIKEKLLSEILLYKTIEAKANKENYKQNVFIETYDLKLNIPTGFSTSKADYWAFILPNDRIIILEKNDLKNICIKNKDRTITNNEKSKLGILLPISELIKY